VGTLRSGSPTHHPTHVDEIIGDDAEGNPTLHSGVGFVPAAVKTVAPLNYADSSLAPRSPFLAIAEPALLLADQAGVLPRRYALAVASAAR
jgi:hypothetical protein